MSIFSGHKPIQLGQPSGFLMKKYKRMGFALYTGVDLFKAGCGNSHTSPAQVFFSYK